MYSSCTSNTTGELGGTAGLGARVGAAQVQGWLGEARKWRAEGRELSENWLLDMGNEPLSAVYTLLGGPKRAADWTLDR